MMLFTKSLRLPATAVLVALSTVNAQTSFTFVDTTGTEFDAGFANNPFETAITVAGLSPTDILTSVEINFFITYAGDLDITLIGPSGIMVELTSDNGGNGDHYFGTVFTDSATTSITAGAAPFTGEFLPEQPLADFLAAPLEGDWTLSAFDDTGLCPSTLLNWTLTFDTPSSAPSSSPSSAPSISSSPSSSPSSFPTVTASNAPSSTPSSYPSSAPSPEDTCLSSKGIFCLIESFIDKFIDFWLGVFSSSNPFD